VEESYRGVSRENVAEGLEQAAILTLRHLSDRTGMGLTANLTLGTLDREGPARVTALAAAASIRQPAMTELVQRLHRQNLVTRVDDPGDGRAALVTITDAGRALLDDERRDRRERLAELLVTLPADDEITLTLAMHVALPIIRRLIDDAQQPRTQTDTDTRSVGRRIEEGGDLIGQTVAVSAALTHLRTVGETVQRVNRLLDS
jgi:DNA-binding MarR family transcriptional regulator